MDPMLSVGWAFAEKMIYSFINSDAKRTVRVCHRVAESELTVIERIVSDFRASTESNLEGCAEGCDLYQYQHNIKCSRLRRQFF